MLWLGILSENSGESNGYRKQVAMERVKWETAIWSEYARWSEYGGVDVERIAGEEHKSLCNGGRWRKRLQLHQMTESARHTLCYISRTCGVCRNLVSPALTHIVLQRRPHCYGHLECGRHSTRGCNFHIPLLEHISFSTGKDLNETTRTLQGISALG